MSNIPNYCCRCCYINVKSKNEENEDDLDDSRSSFPCCYVNWQSFCLPVVYAFNNCKRAVRFNSKKQFNEYETFIDSTAPEMNSATNDSSNIYNVDNHSRGTGNLIVTTHAPEVNHRVSNV